MPDESAPHEFIPDAGDTESASDEMQLPGSPGWMVTFGDTVSLLMTFFVMLLSFSDVSTDVKTAFLTFTKGGGRSMINVVGGTEGSVIAVSSGSGKGGGSGDGNSDGGESYQTVRKKISAEMIAAEATLNAAVNTSCTNVANYFGSDELLQGGSNSAAVSPGTEPGSYEILLDQHFVFALGRAQLQAENKKYLEKISQFVADLPNDILITGYADDVNMIPYPAYPSNAHLAIARASSLAQFLISTGNVVPERVGIRVAQNTDPASNVEKGTVRAKVTVTILSDFNGYARAELQKYGRN